MEFSFHTLPHEVRIAGSYDSSCELSLGSSAFESIRSGKLQLSIRQHGSKNIISDTTIRIDALRGNIIIFLGDDGAKISIGHGSSGAYELRCWRSSIVQIGEGTTSNGVRVVCDQSQFVTGNDCMFSDGVLVQSADQHGLVDLKTGKIINDNVCKVELGDHVWVGRNATLTSDVIIGNGAIIGTGAIVTKNIPAMSIAVGIPARVIRSDMTWSRSPTQLDELSKLYIDQFNARMNN